MYHGEWSNSEDTDVFCLVAIQKQALILHLHPPIGDDNGAKKVVMDSAPPSSNLEADIVLAASCSYRFPDLTHGSFDWEELTQLTNSDLEGITCVP